MRKLLLTILAVILSFTLSYAESCSVSDGSLSYQISDCEEQARACCSGQWCDWGVSSCKSCTSTSKTQTMDCVGKVTNACAGLQSRSCTRTVTGSCGSCTYSSWSCGSYSSADCVYTQSCTDTTQTGTRNCSGNVSNACAGTQTRTRAVAGTCGSCSYNSWGSWTGSCTYTQSCTATSAACSSIGTYTSGTATRTVTGSCGSCTYSAWNTSSCVQCSSDKCWNGSSCASPEATSRNCSGNVSGACAGTQTRTKTCTTGSGWSYGAWTDTCSLTQSCTDTKKSCSYLDSGKPCGTATRSVTGTCGSCTYSSYNTSVCKAESLYYTATSTIMNAYADGVKGDCSQLLSQSYREQSCSYQLGVSESSSSHVYFATKEECLADLTAKRAALLDLGFVNRDNDQACKLSCSSNPYGRSFYSRLNKLGNPYCDCSSSGCSYFIYICWCWKRLGCP